MKVLFASAEVAPFSKTGGLGDVAGALPAALARLGHDVLVVTPWYANLGGGARPYWIGDAVVPFDGGFESVGVGTLERDGVQYAFVGHTGYDRPALYGYPDDVKRFALFSRAALQVAARVGFAPGIVHAHDWHAGYLPLLLGRGWHLPDGFPYLPSVFTVHNVQFQGEAGLAETVHWLRVSPDLENSYLNHFGAANAMQAGVGFAWAVTTVSPTYATELQSPEFGFTLDGTFRTIAPKLTGILNGLDTRAWDPARDELLPANYGARELAGKARCKQVLTDRFGLDPSRPLLAVVSRLAPQKGIDLALDSAPELFAAGWSLLILGSGDRVLEERVVGLAHANPGAAAAKVGYDEGLAHLIYAGADAFAVPSRFEPCGLTQMIAMRYGTLPIVRATGGLRDTVTHMETGFVFEHPTADGFAWAAREALGTFGSERWSAMQANGMGADFSWASSARKYAELYAHVLGSRA